MRKISLLFFLFLAGEEVLTPLFRKPYSVLTWWLRPVMWWWMRTAPATVVELTFGTYRKSTGASVPPRDFTVRLYESGATVQGCSAFQAGQVATLDFGNPGQLDAGGVVTRGAGDGVRVDVRAVDTQADYRGRLTQDSHSVNYPVEFAAKGQFRFRAQPVFPANVKAGNTRVH